VNFIFANNPKSEKFSSTSDSFYEPTRLVQNAIKMFFENRLQLNTSQPVLYS